MARIPRSFVPCTLAACALLTGVVLIGLNVRHGVERCGNGGVQGPHRCCAPGQTETQGRCTGVPTSCPPHFEPTSGGCVARAAPISLLGGTFEIVATDWDVLASPLHKSITVGPFQLDPFEVTYDRFAPCVFAGECAEAPQPSEPGQPVTGLTADGAQRFCVFAGGRLPSEAEWIFAASGGGRHRYPWGPHGLACRRAAFGLERGPCASGGTLPELAGARPDGATRDGLFDLAGNVAEWTLRADSTFVPQGGSFRSLLASSLKSWNTRSSRHSAADDLGFRCAYAPR
jgi:formylglycine-generating enzyme